MPPTTSSVSQSVSAVTLTVSSGSPSTSVSQTFSDSATLASLLLGTNQIQITDSALLTRFATPGLQCSNTLSIAYGGVSDVATPAAVSDFVATPIVLSNFGPSFTYNYLSGGTGTFTLPQPSSNGSSPGAFSYSVVGSTGIVSVSSNVATMIAAGSTTIRATQAAAGGYASAYVETSITINPIAPTFSNGGVFTISSKDFGDAAFTPAYTTSNSSGAFTYTSSDTSVATVNSTSGVVTIVAAGTTTIRATQAAAGGYASAYVEASFVVTTPLLVLDANGVTVKYTDASIPIVPYFIQASPRGTLEWFAVVNDTSKSMITDYANNLSSGSGRTYFTTSGNVVPFNNIVTTLVTDISNMFANMSYGLITVLTFNQNIGSWDTSNVTNMSGLFYGENAFNQNIGSWDVSKVTNMSYMFAWARSFNSPLNSWNVSNVTDMNNMFREDFLFNQNIGSWDTSKVTDMSWMFYAARAFNNNGNPSIGNWNTHNVTNMSTMFQDTWVFNQNISTWNVSNVTNHSSFRGGTTGLSLANSPVWV